MLFAAVYVLCSRSDVTVRIFEHDFIVASNDGRADHSWSFKVSQFRCFYCVDGFTYFDFSNLGFEKLESWCDCVQTGVAFLAVDGVNTDTCPAFFSRAEDESTTCFEFTCVREPLRPFSKDVLALILIPTAFRI